MCPAVGMRLWSDRIDIGVGVGVRVVLEVALGALWPLLRTVVNVALMAVSRPLVRLRVRSRPKGRLTCRIVLVPDCLVPLRLLWMRASRAGTVEMWPLTCRMRFILLVRNLCRASANDDCGILVRSAAMPRTFTLGSASILTLKLSTPLTMLHLRFWQTGTYRSWPVRT